MVAVSPATYAAETPRDPTRPWAPSPFRRLAKTHAMSVAGDAIFTTTIAGLVFFNVSDLNQARWQVALALIFTFVPFTVAAPFIGPMIDRARGGRKWMIVGLCGFRALVCLALIFSRNNPFALYPLFLIMLVLSKGYVIARGTIVPTTVRSDAELVEANSKLSAISGFAAVAGGGPSLLLLKIFGDMGPEASLALAGVVFAIGTVFAFQLPAARTAALPPDEKEEVELDSEGIRHAGTGVSFTRGAVGFLTFMLAFYFKNLDGNEALVGIGVSVAGGQLGYMVGAYAAPRLRKQVSEERMLMISLGFIAVTGLLTALMGALAGAALLSFGVGLASNAAKQAFDALVQRDAPDANRGRAFARFETRHQLIWVVGALIPVAITIPVQLGFILIGAGALISLVVYVVALRRAVAESRRRPSPFSDEPELVEPRLPSRSFLRGRRAERHRRSHLDDLDDFDPDDPDRDGDGVHDATGFAIDPGLDADAEAHRHPRHRDPMVQGLDPGSDAAVVGATAAPARRWGSATDPTMVQAPPAEDGSDTIQAAPSVDATTIEASPPADATAVQPPPPPPPPGTAPDRTGLFADISDLGLDAHGHDPADGLFAVTAPADPVGPAPPSGPILFDSEAWVTEDGLEDPSGPHAIVPARDPGPPSLVPPAPAPPPPPPRPVTAPAAASPPPAGPPAAWSVADPAGAPDPGDSGEFYGAPSEAALYRPPSAVPAPPPPPSSSQLASPSRTAAAERQDAERQDAERPEDERPTPPPVTDIYQDPPWRDGATPPLPGFEPTEPADPADR